MKKALIFCLCILLTEGYAAYTIKDGALVNVEDVATLNVEKHYQCACEAFGVRDWREAIHHFRIVSINFPDTPYGKEAWFYLGLSYYHYGEYEYASSALTNYLKCQNHPNYVEEAIEYKFLVAEAFRSGAKRHIFGSTVFPAWLDASRLAIGIYEEVITAFPCHELAAKSLYSKGLVLWQLQDFAAAIDAYQTLIRRFPKHELAPESYLMISRIYVTQSSKEFQNSDILSLAELNYKKFKTDFPTVDILPEAETNVHQVKESFARGLFETGRFYERVSKKSASILYYQNAVMQFPDTLFAEKCKERMRALGVKDSDG